MSKDCRVVLLICSTYYLMKPYIILFFLGLSTSCAVKINTGFFFLCTFFFFKVQTSAFTNAASNDGFFISTEMSVRYEVKLNENEQAP